MYVCVLNYMYVRMCVFMKVCKSIMYVNIFYNTLQACMVYFKFFNVY